MIGSYRDRDTESIARGYFVARFQAIAGRARNKLRMIEAAAAIDDLRSPPGNRLEKLAGDRAGQWSIRINDQWRVCFEWRNGAAWNVEIADYHR